MTILYNKIKSNILIVKFFLLIYSAFMEVNLCKYFQWSIKIFDVS